MQRSSVDLLPEQIKTELNKRLIQSAFSGYEGLADWLLEQGFSIGKSSVHRYGSRLQEQLERISASTDLARALVAGSPDDQGDINEALSRTIQSKLLDLSLEDMDVKTLTLVSRAAADIGRASLSTKKYRAEIKAKSESAAKEVEAKVRSAGLDEKTAAEIRMKILGIAA